VEQPGVGLHTAKITPQPERPVNTIRAGFEREVWIGPDQNNPPCSLADSDDIEGLLHRICLAEVPDDDADAVR